MRCRARSTRSDMSMNFSTRALRSLALLVFITMFAGNMSLHAQSAIESPEAMQQRISELETEVAELKAIVKTLQPVAVASAAPLLPPLSASLPATLPATVQPQTQTLAATAVQQPQASPASAPQACPQS